MIITSLKSLEYMGKILENKWHYVGGTKKKVRDLALHQTGILGERNEGKRNCLFQLCDQANVILAYIQV